MSGGFLSSAGLSITINLKNNDYSGVVSVREEWSQTSINRTKDLGQARVGSSISLPGTF